MHIKRPLKFCQDENILSLIIAFVVKCEFRSIFLWVYRGVHPRSSTWGCNKGVTVFKYNCNIVYILFKWDVITVKHTKLLL